MTLALCSELSAARWLTAGEVPWDQLVCFGPGGFAAYARLRFLPDPAYEGQRENDVDLVADARSETEQLRIVLDVLSGYTDTPSECYFCLWEGWGLPEPREPMVVVPNRAYLMFRGAVTDLGDRDSATRWPGQPGLGTADPAFIWPADHAWCVADDIDPHWAGIGATRPAIDRLIAHQRVDVVLADPRARQPRYR